MTSTYSNLKVQLMGTGDNSTTWGNVTNTNLGVTLEEAITGSADVPFSGADVTLTLTDTNVTQSARNLRLNLTGTTGGARSLILGSGCQINKVYIINNGCADTITVKNTTGTGIDVPSGKTTWVFNNGFNVVAVTTYLTTLDLGTPLAITSGGTGVTTGLTALNASNITSGIVAVGFGGTGLTTYAIGDIIYASDSTTLAKLADVATGNALISGGVTTAPAWGKIDLTTHISGILPVVNGGTGTSTGFGTMASQDANAVAITGGTLVGASINNSPIGATTRNTGAFTTLSVTTALAANQGGTGFNVYAVGDLVYASTTTALSKLPDVATGNALISGGVGVAPSYGKVGLTTHVSGTLPLANGGTGAATAALAFAAIVAATADTDLTATNGSIKLINGLVLKWGRTTVTTAVDNAATITFTTPFPTACYTFVCSGSLASYSGASDSWVIQLGTASTTSAIVYVAASANAQALTINWFAIGN
jgi:hypothetical protein